MCCLDGGISIGCLFEGISIELSRGVHFTVLRIGKGTRRFGFEGNGMFLGLMGDLHGI